MSDIPQDLVLNALRKSVGEVAYAADAALDAMTLQLAVSHAGNDTFVTRGHFCVRAKHPQTGKTTFGAHVPLLFAYNPWKVGKKTTDPAMVHKFLDVEPSNWIADDIGKIFGDAGNNGKTSTLYSVMAEGYENTATVSMSRNGVTQDVPAFVQVFMNGLHKAIPGDIATRCVLVNAVARPKNVVLKSALHPDTKARALQLQRALHCWVAAKKEELAWFALNSVDRLHPKLVDRLAQIYGPMAAMANAAGGEWPGRFMNAFMTLALDASDRPVITPDDQLKLDVASVLNRVHVPRIFTFDLMEQLRLMPESVYAELSDGGLQDLLFDVLGEATTIRGESIARGEGSGPGWIAAPVLKEARVIRDLMMPEPAPAAPDPIRANMAFTPIGA